MYLIVPTSIKGVWFRRGYMGPRSRSFICARALAILQSDPNIRMSLQHMVLRKKMHELCTRYLASDVLADILV